MAKEALIMAEQLLELTRTTQVLKQLAEDVRLEYVKNFIRSGHNTMFGRDRLVDTISVQVTVDDRSFTASLRMNKYWEYLEYGTGPKRGRDKYWPPSDAIAKWIDIKPVIPRPDKNTGRIPTPKQLNYLIRRKIHDEGITGTKDFEKARDELVPQYYERIKEALTADIGDFLWKVLIY